MTLASTIALAIVPESPKYLYSKGDYEGCRKALLFFAQSNKKQNVQKIRFDKENYSIQ